ncbi:17175_t:CDS:2, partial [Funneliformis geosporum]
EVENKLVIRIDQEDRAPKFSIADDISEVYSLPRIHECINGQKPLKAVIDIDISQEDMKTSGVKAQEVFIRICFSFIRVLYRILDCSWKDILNGLVIATSSDSSKCSYHILYAPALLIDHCELKTFTKLVYTITGEKFGKFIDQKLPDNGWNELNHARVQPPTSLRLEVRPQMLTTETYKEKYIRPLPNEGDIYIGSPWETGKTYILEHLTLSDVVNLLALSTCHSYSNAVTTRLNLTSYCDIDGNINLSDYKRARRIIIMDNDLTDLNIEWIKALHKDKPFSIIHNTYQPQKGKTFCLAPNIETKDMQGIVHTLNTDFPELRIKEYYSKSDPVEKAHNFSNVEESWSGVNLVAYTSTLKIGVSYTNPKKGLFQWLLKAKCKCLPCELQNREIFPDIDSIIQNKDMPTI